MAKKKSLFTYKKGRQPSNTNAYKDLQKIAKEARERKDEIRKANNEFIGTQMPQFKSFFKNQNYDIYHGKEGHERYTSIMDEIPESFRDKYRELASDETFYWGDQLLEGQNFPDVDISFEQYKKDELEILAQFLDNPPKNGIDAF